MATIDERVASLETKSALQDEKINGLATAAMLAEMRLSMEQRFGAVENSLTAIQSTLPSLATKAGLTAIEAKLPSLATTANVYRAIGLALAFGLGAVFAMFKYLFPH